MNERDDHSPSSAPASSVTVEAIMTRDVVTVSADTVLYEVQQRFREGRFRHVLVTAEDGSLIGVLSDRDLLRATSPYFNTSTESLRDVQALMRSAGESVRHTPITASLDTTVKEAVGQFLEEGISCLPVLAPDGTIAGLVTSTDVMRYVAEQ